MALSDGAFEPVRATGLEMPGRVPSGLSPSGVW